MAYVQAVQLGREPEKQKESTMDKILKGLTIANSVLGAVDTISNMGTKAEANKLSAENAALTNAQLKRQESGQYNAIEYAKAYPADKYIVSSNEAPGAQGADVIVNGAIERRYAAPRPEDMSLYQSEMLGIERSKLHAANNPTPQKKLSGLSAEAQNKVGSIGSGLRALDDMIVASEHKFGPTRIDSKTPLVGSFVSDTPYTKSERVLAEVVGRLQSGGAIGDKEAATFKAMGPRPGDDNSIRAQKLQDQKVFLENKLAAFGMSEGDLEASNIQTKGGLREFFASLDKNKEPNSIGEAQAKKKVSQSTKGQVGQETKTLNAGIGGGAEHPDLMQNGHVYKWNLKTGRYE